MTKGEVRFGGVAHLPAVTILFAPKGHRQIVGVQAASAIVWKTDDRPR
jgi:hypothetical protein